MGADMEAPSSDVLYQGRLVWGWLLSRAVFFLIMLAFVWRLVLVVVPQVLTYWEQGDLVDGVLRLGIVTMMGYVAFLGAWQTWVGLRLIRRITVADDQVAVERVFGRWVGSGGGLLLRRLGPPLGFGLPWYRLERLDGRSVGHIIVNWPENKEGVERLKAWLSQHGRGYEER